MVRSLAIALLLSAGFLPLHHLSLTAAAAPQEEYEQHDEVLARLAAGRVIVVVFKDAILIASIENKIETDSLTPPIVQLNGRHAAILLGAISWNSPSPPVEWARLDRELPNLRANALSAVAPHMAVNAAGQEATDIENVGEGLRVRLSAVMKHIPGKLDVPEGEPLTELILADYVADYGAEVWTLQYGIDQQVQRGEFWDTKIQRPRYAQLWPPEKTDPHTVMEIQYPVGTKTPTLLDLQRQKDPRLEAIRNSDPQMTAAANVLATGGDTSKLLTAVDAVPYFRACFNLLTPPGANLVVALIDRERGFDWILAPPHPQPARSTASDQSPPQPGQKDRPADAPSLLKPPPQ